MLCGGNTLRVGRVMVAYAENDAVPDREKSAWGMFYAGAKVVTEQYLIDLGLRLGFKKMGIDTAPNTKDAIRYLNKLVGTDAQKTRAFFNNTMLKFYENELISKQGRFSK